MFKTGILIMSDKGSRGEREDLSGPQIQTMLGEDFSIDYYEIIPDEQELIQKKLIFLCDDLKLIWC